MKQIILTILAVICLSVSFLTSGIMVCTYCPQITDGLTKATALTDTAKFSRDQLVQMANTTRKFVSGEADKDQLYSQIEKINKDAKTQYKDVEGHDFAAVPEEFSLAENGINHLIDVKSFLANARIAFGICSVAGIGFLILLLVLCGRSAFGRTLCWTGGILILAMVILGVWAIIDFNSLFNWLHSLFFKNNSWFFSQTSLMISMFPTPFWTGMAIICVGSTFVLSVISVFIGKIIK